MTTPPIPPPRPAPPIRAPFTADQVRALEAFQQSGFHPLTCVTHSTTSLVPEIAFLRCPHGDYVQEWAPGVCVEPPATRPLLSGFLPNDPRYPGA